MIRYDLKQII